MPVDVTLHTHTADGSSDAVWGEAEAAEAYRSAGIVSAVTDHDAWTPTGRISGVEHTVERRSKLHVVELQDGFTFLAHPRYPFPNNTRERAAEYVRAHGLDGVEKYNNGRRQYSGTIPGVVELANDDAHSPWTMGSSFMRLQVESTDERTVMREIRAGRFTAHNDPNALDRLMGQVSKGVRMVSNGTVATSPDKMATGVRMR